MTGRRAQSGKASTGDSSPGFQVKAHKGTWGNPKPNNPPQLAQ